MNNSDITGSDIQSFPVASVLFKQQPELILRINPQTPAVETASIQTKPASAG